MYWAFKRDEIATDGVIAVPRGVAPTEIAWV
jgi:hypothetical protein